jgi:hypothetical protein
VAAAEVVVVDGIAVAAGDAVGPASEALAAPFEAVVGTPAAVIGHPEQGVEVGIGGRDDDQWRREHGKDGAFDQ